MINKKKAGWYWNPGFARRLHWYPREAKLSICKNHYFSQERSDEGAYDQEEMGAYLCDDCTRKLVEGRGNAI